MDVELEKSYIYADIALRCIESKHSLQKSTFSQLGMQKV